MEKKSPFTRLAGKHWSSLGLYAPILIVTVIVVQHFANPAPPRRIVIAAGADEGDYQTFAKLYRDIIKREGVELEIRPSTGARENLKLLKDDHSDIDVAFVQDGLDNQQDSADLISLGSLYYEPMWIFYRGKETVTRISQLAGKRIAIGEHGAGTPVLARHLLQESGVSEKNAQFLRLDFTHAVEALKNGQADVAFFLTTPEDEWVTKLLHEPSVKLMSLDQSEAITRRIPYLHHLVLPHGAIDLAKNIPAQDVDLISATATLVAKEGLNPALIDLLLKAAVEVHGEPGIFERKGEFPIDKDYDFPLSKEAQRFYKSGAPFWQRYLPFWLATLIDRFILVILPLLVLVFPLVKAVPKFLEWRVRSRIYKRYGELKYLETQMKAETDNARYGEHNLELDAIEERVNHMKVPIEFTEHVYVLREHIDFVRGRLKRGPRVEKTA